MTTSSNNARSYNADVAENSVHLHARCFNTTQYKLLDIGISDARDVSIGENEAGTLNDSPIALAAVDYSVDRENSSHEDRKSGLQCRLFVVEQRKPRERPANFPSS